MAIACEGWAMAAGAFDLKLRIIVVDPVPGVALALQRGKAGASERIAPSNVSAGSTAFDFTVAAAPAGEGLRLLGPFVQGPPDGRFVYVCVGALAGDPASPWSRRIKIPLTGLTRPLVDGLDAGGRLEARIAGRDRHGVPACARIPLLPPGWRKA
jgi:hypothetical protein